LLPTFEQRVRHVALSIRIHHGRDLMARKFVELAEALIKDRDLIAAESRR
jgi:hypothetical protein